MGILATGQALPCPVEHPERSIGLPRYRVLSGVANPPHKGEAVSILTDTI